MSVMIETSLGVITIDLFYEKAPRTSKNFLKLCAMKYYNNCIFHNVQKDLLAQTGDPSWTGLEGCSAAGLIDPSNKFLKLFPSETCESLKHDQIGTVSMAVAARDATGSGLHASQFFITLRKSIEYMDGTHTVFGRVVEGMDVLSKINESYCDDKNRPFRNIRIKHVVVLDDPFQDPGGMPRPQSPVYVPKDHRVDADTPLETMEGVDDAAIARDVAAKEALARANVLTMIGDLPEADAAPPEEVLFICKLNPVTTEEDLEVVFGRFGRIKKTEIIKDAVTDDSLCYGFVEYEDKDACIAAYTKMDNVLIDDRRIHVDFCQSVAKVWRNRGAGLSLNAARTSTGGAKRKAPRSPPQERNRGDHGKDRRRQQERHKDDDRHSSQHRRQDHRSRSGGRSRNRDKERDRDRGGSSRYTRN